MSLSLRACGTLKVMRRAGGFSLIEILMAILICQWAGMAVTFYADSAQVAAGADPLAYVVGTGPAGGSRW